MHNEVYIKHALVIILLLGTAHMVCQADDDKSSTLLPGQGEKLIRIGLHGFQTLAFPSPDIDATEDPLFNNAGVSAVWLLDRKHAFGIEFGRENILQEFTRSIGRADIRYEQNYLAWYLGLAYENTSERWESAPEVSTFLRVVAAGISTGPLLRISGGLNYELLDLLNLRLGLDLSAAIYRADSLWFTAKKVGFRFGMDVEI